MTFSKQQDTQILCQTGYNQPIMVGIQSVGWLIQSMTVPPCLYSIENKEHEEFLCWSGSHPQRRKYPLQVPTMTSHCFDNTDQVLYHPTREQHLNWHAQVDIFRMDNQGGMTRGQPYHVL
jgi:hypothetical protein